VPDSIGPFQFVRLEASPDRAQDSWEVVSRAGVNGTALWMTGSRGNPFRLRSQAVALTFAAAETFLERYTTLVSLPPVIISRGGFPQFQQRYKVLNVTPDGPGAVATLGAFVGGDPTRYLGLVFASWHLLPIDPTVLPP
jgi:hypothetical protein